MNDAAFGGDPGRWPLPPASTPQELWWRAVAAGGQGRYACAMTDLELLRRELSGGRLASLAWSTHASFARQLGWHDRARSLDGKALTLSGDDGEAAADALIGLAADALGVGRFAASARALQRAADLVSGSSVARLPVRFAWVSAELAMSRGDGGAAVDHAERALHLAGTLGSTRHRIKSGVVLAAARCSCGDVAAARRQADEVLVTAGASGLVPLRWAVACLLCDIGSGQHLPAEVAAIRDCCVETVTRRGGVWRSR
ncbi:Uncharacterised protein [Mycolicibacterium vanbaalenii]|uniref:Uncharacterized protein n=1 Tax=Mycolicibacterium vanbaalenii TaxID=110539 RepID=A0A5S9R480_MYCVN|nr:hypothetical protein [Mycolicibacterium vanbaalenii]CAA0127436.1 Uncharacterised protein [Mycolicibacterium vanbaalenii]